MTKAKNMTLELKRMKNVKSCRLIFYQLNNSRYLLKNVKE